MADPTTDAAIARRWPDKWFRANDPRLPHRAKARQLLRRRYALTLEHEQFRADNPSANCGNCDHGHSYRDKFSCLLDSDFCGYQIVDPADVCTRWKASTQERTA